MEENLPEAFIKDGDNVMKRVLFFTHHLSSGGAEKCVRTIAEYLYQHKEEYQIDPYIAVVYDDPEARAELHQVIVLRHHSEPDFGKIHKACNVLKQAGELRKIKKELQIDTCVSFLPGADLLNCLSAVGERRVVSVRNKESLFTHSIWKKKYVLFSYHHCDQIVAVSEVVRQDVISFFGMKEEKVVAIPNSAPGVNLTGEVSDAFRTFTKDRRVLLNVGRLKPEKGQLHLLRAFSVIAREHPELCLVILGEGNIRPLLEKEIDRLDLNNRVRLEGYHSNVSDYMKEADFFVLSSNIEGMPNVIIEAMQAGLPVISTECGAREILDLGSGLNEVGEEIYLGRYGILTPVCGQETTEEQVREICTNTELSKEEMLLARAMGVMLSDDSLQKTYQERAREGMKRFDIHEIAGQWAAIL